MRKILTLEDTCTGCNACYNICTQDAILMLENEEGFLYPSIDDSKCIDCGECDDICPVLNNDKEEKLLHTAFYGWHIDDDIRRKSSSGGIFSALADEVMKREGIVYGAIHDLSKKSVYHTSTNKVDISALRKSKYVQSNIGYSFREAENDLKSGKEVLFCGTPCQIAGLKAFLKNTYSQLLTCDFICHGVPPMKMLNDHLSLLEKKFKSNVSEVDFRPKTFGWSVQSLKCSFINNSEYKKPFQFDAYFSAFISNYSLRKSCYNCSYSNKQHNSNLTLADFWGYRRFNPEIKDEKGLSLIIANTKKGETILSELKKFNLIPIEWKYVKYVYKHRDAKRYNNIERKNFFSFYIKNGWRKTISKFHLKGTYKSRMKFYVVNKIIHKSKE